MTGEPAVPQNKSEHDGARPFARAIGLMNAVGTIWIIGLMILINADIFGRSALNSPIAGVPELVAFSIVGIVFLQLAHTLRAGAMTRSDVLLTVLERRAPRVRHGLLAFFHFLGGALMLLIAWKFWPSVAAAWSHPERHFMGNPGFFTISHWPLFILIFLGIAATAVQFLLMSWSDFRACQAPAGTSAAS